MLRAKLAVVLMSPLALTCAFSAAQELPQNCTVKAPESPRVLAVPAGDTYGAYVPFTEPPPQAASQDATSCSTPSVQPAAPVNSSRQMPSSQTIPDRVQSNAADLPPLSCNTELWVADKNYGPYVPYTGPVKACFIRTDQTAHNSSRLNLSPSIELPADLVKFAAPGPAAIAPGALPPIGASESTSMYVRSIPVPLAVTGPPVEMHRFHGRHARNRYRNRHAACRQLQPPFQRQLLRLQRSLLDRWSRLQRQAPSPIQSDHPGLVSQQEPSHQPRLSLRE
jgi:hypothetical protein